jgi:hypothetical protein
MTDLPTGSYFSPMRDETAMTTLQDFVEYVWPIITDLAAANEPLSSYESGNDEWTTECALGCAADGPHDGAAILNHAVSCPWRRARDVVNDITDDAPPT